MFTFGLESLTFFIISYANSKTRHLLVVIQNHDFKKWDFTKRKRFLDSAEITEIRWYWHLLMFFQWTAAKSELELWISCKTVYIGFESYLINRFDFSCVATIGTNNNANTFNAFKQITFICEPGDFDYFLLQI